MCTVCEPQYGVLDGLSCSEEVEGGYGLWGTVKRMPLGTLCNVCAVKKQKCFLPKLVREQRLLLPLGKRKQDKEPGASESKVKAGSAGIGETESPKKKKKKVEVVMPPREV